MTTKKKSIDEAVDGYETYVGLAKEAAAQPLPRADVDIEYFLTLASTRGGKTVDLQTRTAVWELFSKAQADRIKRVEQVIKRYEKEDTTEAHAQLAWYAKELTRLKEWKKPR